MGYRENLYNVVLTLHLLAAIVGFGAVSLNGIYAAKARADRGPGGVAVFKAVQAVSDVAMYFIYAVFVFGVLLVVLSDEAIGWGDPWVNVSMLLYFVSLGLSHAVLRPAAKRIGALQEELLARSGGGPSAAGGPPPQAAEMEQLGKRMGLVSAVLNVLLVVILALMVFKPGASAGVL